MDEVEDQIHAAAHPQGPQRAPQPPVDQLHGHAYLEFTASTDPARHYGKLRRMHVGAHVVVDWDALEAIGERPRLRYFIPVDSPWHHLFELAHTPTYRELLVEFLSTFTFHPPRVDQPLAQPYAPPLRARFLSGLLVFGVR
ncbi:hypothetical protein HanPI659440_Chr05g0196311 [Helianthus annuus]|nr:hypothetical protein HanPI659440_Chr05g0196311 [Helianthus annuus]